MSLVYNMFSLWCIIFSQDNTNISSCISGETMENDDCDFRSDFGSVFVVASLLIESFTCILPTYKFTQLTDIWQNTVKLLLSLWLWL